MTETCPNCGEELTSDNAAGGLCGRCLFERGIELTNTVALAEGSTPGSHPFAAPDPVEVEADLLSFDVLELIGQGGMGAVYKAYQRSLDRTVAIKILPRQATGGHEFAERFQREARALARLRHENIVMAYDYGLTDRYLYSVMEYVGGPNLRQHLRSQTVEPRRALEIARDVCAALQFAHENGVVHRDIKPENILLDDTGHLKIADFGLAKLLQPDPRELALTHTRHFMGTVHYMAPEQSERPHETDHRADIYSVGVVLYEMLTGELPLGRFDPPSSRTNLDERVDDLVFRALEKDSARRYDTAASFGAAIVSLLHEGAMNRSSPLEGEAGRGAKPQANKSSTFADRGRPRRGPLIAAGFCAFLIAAYFGWQFFLKYQSDKDGTTTLSIEAKGGDDATSKSSSKVARRVPPSKATKTHDDENADRTSGPVQVELSGPDQSQMILRGDPKDVDRVVELLKRLQGAKQNEKPEDLIRRLRDAGAKDKPGAPKTEQVLQVFRLKYVKASEIAEELRTILGTDAGRFEPDHRTNSIVVMADRETLGRVQTLLKRIDQSGASTQGRVEPTSTRGNAVFESLKLGNAPASEAENAIRDRIRGFSGRVAVDERTNSVLVEADEETMEQVKDVLQQLDEPISIESFRKLTPGEASAYLQRLESRVQRIADQYPLAQRAELEEELLSLGNAANDSAATRRKRAELNQRIQEVDSQHVLLEEMQKHALSELERLGRAYDWSRLPTAKGGDQDANGPPKGIEGDPNRKPDSSTLREHTRKLFYYHEIKPQDGAAVRISPNHVLQLSAAGTIPESPIEGVYNIDLEGFVNLGAEYGKVKVLGLTADQAQDAILNKLRETLREPKVVVSIEEGSTPSGSAKQQLEQKNAGPIHILKEAHALRISVSGTVEGAPIDGLYTLDLDGYVNLGAEHGKVKVAGLTADEAEKAVLAELSKVLRNPTVVLTIEERSQAQPPIRISAQIRRDDLTLRVPFTIEGKLAGPRARYFLVADGPRMGRVAFDVTPAMGLGGYGAAASPAAGSNEGLLNSDKGLSIASGETIEVFIEEKANRQGAKPVRVSNIVSLTWDLPDPNPAKAKRKGEPQNNGNAAKSSADRTGQSPTMTLAERGWELKLDPAGIVKEARQLPAEQWASRVESEMADRWRKSNLLKQKLDRLREFNTRFKNTPEGKEIEKQVEHVLFQTRLLEPKVGGPTTQIPYPPRDPSRDNLVTVFDLPHHSTQIIDQWPMRDADLPVGLRYSEDVLKEFGKLAVEYRFYDHTPTTIIYRDERGDVQAVIPYVLVIKGPHLGQKEYVLSDWPRRDRVQDLDRTPGIIFAPANLRISNGEPLQIHIERGDPRSSTRVRASNIVKLTWTIPGAPTTDIRYPEKLMKPFTAIHWENGRPQVELNDLWHEIVAINGHSIDKILEHAKKTYPDKQETTFENDLPLLMHSLDEKPSGKFHFDLRRLDNGQRHTISVQQSP